MNTQKMNSGIRGRIYLLMALIFSSAIIFTNTAHAGVPPAKLKKASVSQTEDPYHTAIKHADFAEKAANLKDIQMHLHHVLNCLEGKKGKEFDASYGNPCQGEGALQTLDKGSANMIRTNNCIDLAKVGIRLHEEKPARLVAETVYTILMEGK